MDTRRLIILAVFFLSIYMLWTEWERYNNPAPPPAATTAAPAVATGAPTVSDALSTPNPTLAAPGSQQVPAASATAAAETPKPIRVRTDKLVADISPIGGEILRLELLDHRATESPDRNLLLVDPDHRYAIQSGLIGDGLPTHRANFRIVSNETELGDRQSLVVDLEADGGPGVVVRKRYEFRRGDYRVLITQQIDNRGTTPLTTHAYYQFQRDGRSPPGESSMTMTYTGPAIYTEVEKFKKISFDDIAGGGAKFPTITQDGWIAMVQHYFVAAWLPPATGAREFFMRKLEGDLYTAGVIVPVAEIAPGSSAEATMTLYAGPQEQATLEKLAPGLDLVVDYGWLTVIAAPIFWMLDFIHGFVGNWGWAIVILTILIKLAFFPLSAASYRSMARMRQMTPRMMQIKERYGDDRQRMNQEMMELYRKEKINPLGGCLPILIQIPVFIALYWVLLGAVEMRGAPWILWIHDLSRADPYYVLPVVMVVSMIIQMRLNPTPPDPIQAKIMMAMPFVFGVMFFFFPAGLVLYWVVNNILSIGQQWQITRMIEGGKDRSGK
ncbi:MAG TPA: membrane protein insertase YidC [Rhodocyclaceae bacterium]